MTLLIPARKILLADFRKHAKRGNAQFQATRLVRRWINCGYDINELPLLVTGLTSEIIAAGTADAAR